MGTRGRALPLFLSSFSVFSTIFFFAPIQIYLANLASFSVPIGYHALAGLALALGAAAASAVVLLLPGRAYSGLVAAFLAAAAGLWIQGNLLVWRYGLMDGRPIDWGAHWKNGAIDGTVWLLLAVGAWRYSAALVKGARTLALALLILQTMSLGALAWRTRDTQVPQKIQIDERGKLELSTTRNIVLLIFDEFQGDLFPEVLARDPQLREAFDGFVYFPDTLAGASFTEVAVPFLMTGELYDNSVPRSRFLAQAFTRQGISTMLLEEGYDAEIYPWDVLANDAIYLREGIAGNFKRHVASPGYRKELREYALLLDVGLFRYVPHLLKRRLYDQGTWGWRELSVSKTPQRRGADYSDNNAALAPLIRESRADKSVPVFKVYHFAGAHIPLHDYEGTGEKVEYNRENYLRVYTRLLRQAGEYLARLKQIGVYDRTMIFILGDHGSGRSPDLYLRPEVSPSEMGAPPGAGADFQLWKARGLPLLLAKDFASRGSLRVSQAPASLGDLPKTIAAAAGLRRPLPGYGLFQLPDDAKRTRTYEMFTWSPKSSEYLTPITRYSVTGKVWLDKSWRVEKTLLPPGP